MRFVPVRDLRIRPGGVFTKLRENRELVLTSRGKPIAVMAAASEDDFKEIVASFQSARALGALRRIRARAQALGLEKLTDAEIDAEIHAARQARRAKAAKRRAGAHRGSPRAQPSPCRAPWGPVGCRPPSSWG